MKGHCLLQTDQYLHNLAAFIVDYCVLLLIPKHRHCVLACNHAMACGSKATPCALQANTKYEEMRIKATEAVPDKIKDMVKSHSNDMNAEVRSSQMQFLNKSTAQPMGACNIGGVWRV